MLTDHEKHYSKQDDLVDEKCAKINQNHIDNLRKADQKMNGSILKKKRPVGFRREIFFFLGKGV